MNRWWRNVVKDYLTFSRKEKAGLLLLLIIILAIYLIPKFFKPKHDAPDYAAFNKEVASLRVSIDTAKASHRYRNYDDDERLAYTPSKPFYKSDGPMKGELFNFDPNTLGEAGWKRLGVRDRTVQTIMKFTGKGFKFRKPEDLKKIYGLRPEEVDRLLPYVQIKSSDHPAFAANNSGGNNEVFTAKPPVSIKPIDINEADTTALIALPGIGSKLATRIINFRDKLGGFASVNQVGETYGVPDSTFQKIKARLLCNHPSLKTIDINKADVNALKSHPYLRWNMANAIVNYRQQHGLFKTVDELKKIDIITEDVYSKVAPYLTASN